MSDAEQVRVLADATFRSYEKFKTYERLHLAKSPPDTEKARANAEMAELCYKALDAAGYRVVKG